MYAYIQRASSAAHRNQLINEIFTPRESAANETRAFAAAAHSRDAASFRTDNQPRLYALAYLVGRNGCNMFYDYTQLMRAGAGPRAHPAETVAVCVCVCALNKCLT